MRELITGYTLNEKLDVLIYNDKTLEFYKQVNRWRKLAIWFKPIFLRLFARKIVTVSFDEFDKFIEYYNKKKEDTL